MLFRSGGTAPTVLNAANEIAVEAFLNGSLAFTDIPRVIDDVLANTTIGVAESLSHILAADSIARHHARERIARSALQRSAAE